MNTALNLYAGAESKSRYKRSDAITVFIVEDAYATRMLLERYLSKLPRFPGKDKPELKIHAFKSGEDCLLNLHLQPDIVIMDYYLDENGEDSKDAMNGLTLLKRLQEKLPNAKVISMSGQPEPMVVSLLFQHGVRHYITKDHACETRVEEALIELIGELKKEQRWLPALFWYAFAAPAVGFGIGMMLG